MFPQFHGLILEKHELGSIFVPTLLRLVQGNKKERQEAFKTIASFILSSRLIDKSPGETVKIAEISVGASSSGREIIVISYTRTGSKGLDSGN